MGPSRRYRGVYPSGGGSIYIHHTCIDRRSKASGVCSTDGVIVRRRRSADGWRSIGRPIVIAAAAVRDWGVIAKSNGEYVGI